LITCQHFENTRFRLMLSLCTLLANVSAAPATNSLTAGRLTIRTPSVHTTVLYMGLGPPPSARPKHYEITNLHVAVRPVQEYTWSAGQNMSRSNTQCITINRMAVARPHGWVA